MKRIFIYMLAIVLMTIGIIVDGFGSSKIGVNLNTGFGWRTFYGSPIFSEYEGFGMGYLFGTSLDYQVSQKDLMGIGLNIERKGHRIKVNYKDSSGILQSSKETINLDYLSLQITDRRLIRQECSAFILAGGYFGYKLTENRKIISSGMKYEYKSRVLKNVDFGLIFGIGTKVGIVKNHDSYIFVQNTLGIINLSRLPLINDKTLKNNVLQIIFQFSI